MKRIDPLSPAMEQAALNAVQLGAVGADLTGIGERQHRPLCHVPGKAGLRQQGVASDRNVGRQEGLASRTEAEQRGGPHVAVGTAVSAATKASWWVPWEIGVATEKDYPIATFAGDYTPLPEYLKKWLFLQSMEDVDAYARASKTAHAEYRNRRSYQADGVARRTSTKDFYRVLRSSLRQ